jgi:hypothetical protein
MKTETAAGVADALVNFSQTATAPVSLDYEPGPLDQSCPPKIWLQIDANGDNDDRSESLLASSWNDLTWCYESIGGREVVYIRADMVAQPAAVLAESLGGDAEDRDPSVFEQWYVENAPDFESNPIGTRQCWLMRKAWNAACYAHAAKPTTPSPTPKKDDDNG